jgi:hypothetical protein
MKPQPKEKSMAMQTVCQTPDAQFHTKITNDYVSMKIDFGKVVPLTDEEATLLESNLHNAVELVLARYYIEN